MLYLLKPTGVTWSDITTRILENADHPDIDLERLAWKPADQPLSADLIRLAIRYGHPTANGIVVEAHYNATITRPGEMRALQREGAEIRARGKKTFDMVDQVLDAQAPGWAAESAAINARADESFQESIDEAQRDAAELFETEVNPALLTHWTRLLGRVPDPA